MPHGVYEHKPTPAVDRFWRKVALTANPDKCWLWQASLWGGGYGQFSVINPKRRVYAHRFSYELANGPIPEGLQVDHICHIRTCVNPRHLRAITQKENTLAENSLSVSRQHSLKTHCPQGHPYSGDNLGYGSHGERRCKTCDAKRMRLWYLRKKGNA